MACPDCDASLVPFAVPPDLREYVFDGPETIAICTRCLSLHQTDESNADPDFSRISGSFPQGEAAIPMALMLGLLESLALYRTEIENLFERVERNGADPLLVIDRLAVQGSIQPQWDAERRQHQLEQFLE